MITRHTLKNGLRIITEDIPSVRSVAIGIWVKTGSRYEEADINGISHFIEHMLFKGTKTRSPQDIAEAFDSIGGNVNAFTSKEYTCYYAKVLDEHVEKGLEVLADMYFNSIFDETELNRERNVILEEIKMYEDAPDDQIHDLIAKAAYNNNSLGNTILGSEQALNKVNKDSIINYTKEKYTVENTVIAVAGNISENIINIIEKYFNGFNTHGNQKQAEKAVFSGKEIIKAKQTEQAHIAFALPGLALSDLNIYSLILLNNILGGSMSSRLFQEIREKRGLAYSVFSYHSSYHDTGLFTIYAGTTPKQVDDVVEIIQETLHEIKDNGIYEKEIIKGKEQIKGSLMLSLESTNSRMNRIGKNELLLGKHFSLDEILKQIEQVNSESIQGVIKQIFNCPLSFAMISPLDQIPYVLRRDILVSN